jgi:hypothetical protein
MRNIKIAVSRRNAIAFGGVAALAALSAPDRAAAVPSIQSGGGLAGGGSVAVQGGGEANFSVFGSRFVVDGQTEPLIFGSLIWADSNGVELSSVKVVDYGPAGGDPNARRLEGFATLNGEGNHPFTLMLFPEAGPGKGADRVQLKVLAALPSPATPEGAASPNAAAEPVYSSDDALKSGDLQLLTFDFPD